MWKHNKKYKRQSFLGTYEYLKKPSKRVFRLKNAVTGEEVGMYNSAHAAKKDGWSLN